MEKLAKKLGIIGTVFITSFLFWFYAKPWVNNPFKFSDVNVWLTPLLLLVVLTVITVLALSLVEPRLWALAVTGAVALPFLIVFGFSYLAGVAIALMFALFLAADKTIDQETRNRIKVAPGHLIRRGAPYALTPLFLMLSFGFYLSPTVQDSSETKQLPPNFRQVVGYAVNQFAGGQLKDLPPQERQTVANQAIDYVLNEINTFLGPYFKFLPPVLAFALFLVLQSLSIFFALVSIPLGMLIFWLLKKAGFVSIVTEDVKVERISLS